MLLWYILALIGFAQALLLSIYLVPIVRDGADRMGLLDRPGLARKLHDRPIPRSGGIAIFGAFWLVLWADVFAAGFLVPHLPLPDSVRALGANVALKLPELMGVFLGCTTIFILGLLDDRFDLPPGLRLAIQVLACVPLLATGVVLKLFLPAWLAWPITIVWLVLLTNSFNFLDNMNGLTSGVAILISLIMGVMAALSREWYIMMIFVILAGAIWGFWRHNFPNASVFLGDCGSTHLGFLLGSLAILATYWQEGVPTRLPILIPLIIFGIPLFDTISVMWIRWSSGKPLMVGDTNHLSHRLVALGMTRTEAVVFIYVAVVVLGLAAQPLRVLEWKLGLLQAIFIALIFLLLHWLERVSYRRRQVADPPR
jgi:UDP-GlcNAc:undecaprenyl-phosphate GlcNAc-1-phosphate transferase